eukprot:CAMPEP_0196656746 /NCGR_PEP_ID=MMETSP1086-20130531/19418_1 /TAXON_ID=77921 /ORGANISM="Cyanoptyche  gloeocystis , Strain SAG4.97" /LENGTH=589 /DNA_ID=CAMNT_0041989609 /DNA_START=104 /DNA_END=1870 /DNA_ORIENTATION=+
MCFYNGESQSQREPVVDISKIAHGAVKPSIEGEAREESLKVANNQLSTAGILSLLPPMPNSGGSGLVQRVTLGLAKTYVNIYEAVATNPEPKVEALPSLMHAAVASGKDGVDPVAANECRLEDQNVHKGSLDDDDADLDDEDGFHKEKPGEVIHSRYVVEDLVGKGTFGKVLKCYDRVRREYVVIKMIRNTPAFFEASQREIQMLNVINKADPHDRFNIVRMKDHFVFHSHQCIVFELLAESLYDLLRAGNFRGVSLNAIRKFCRQILVSLDFMSRPDVNVMHCDLKPENILLRTSNSRAIKVIDFGSSCQETRQYYTYIQSRYYRAPEVIFRLPCYTRAIDMWSLGCLLCEMHTGQPIFDGRDILEQVQSMCSLLGIPPDHMLRRGTQTSSYFTEVENDCDDGCEGRWELVPWISREKGMKRRNLNDILGVYSNGPGGRWKNHPGHTSADYRNFKDLVEKMLAYSPTQRITPAEALNHPFFTNDAKGLRRPTVERPVGFDSSSAEHEWSATKIDRDDDSTGVAVLKWKQGSANDKLKFLGGNRADIGSDNRQDGFADADFEVSTTFDSVVGHAPLISKSSAVCSKKQG